jgi:dynein heavy chain
MIEDIVKSIEDSVILKEFNFQDTKDSPLNPSEFAVYSDEYMLKTVVELSEKYKIIGDQFLKNIEEFVLGTSTKCSLAMKEYYYYW